MNPRIAMLVLLTMGCSAAGQAPALAPASDLGMTDGAPSDLAKQVCCQQDAYATCHPIACPEDLQ